MLYVFIYKLVSIHDGLSQHHKKVAVFLGSTAYANQNRTSIDAAAFAGFRHDTDAQTDLQTNVRATGSLVTIDCISCFGYSLERRDIMTPCMSKIQ